MPNLSTPADALRAAAEIAWEHRKEPQARRQKLGIKLGHLTPEAQEEIRAEERGECIAAERIHEKILKLLKEL